MVVIQSQFSRNFGRSLGKFGNESTKALSANMINGKINYSLGNEWESCYGAQEGTEHNVYIQFIALFKS